MLEGGEIYGIVQKHWGIGGVVVAKGLIDYDGDVKDSSLTGLSDHSATRWGRRGRSDRVFSFQ